MEREADVDQLLSELVAVTQGAASLDNLTPVAMLLTNGATRPRYTATPRPDRTGRAGRGGAGTVPAADGGERRTRAAGDLADGPRWVIHLPTTLTSLDAAVELACAPRVSLAHLPVLDFGEQTLTEEDKQFLRTGSGVTPGSTRPAADPTACAADCPTATPDHAHPARSVAARCRTVDDLGASAVTGAV